MSDNWDAYFCNVNDVFSSIFVDLGIREDAPDPLRPHLLWVWVPMLAPRDDGLSSSDEAPTLSAIEDAHPFGLTLEREDTAEQSSVDSAVFQILDALEGRDASYDGWESPVVA